MMKKPNFLSSIRAKLFSAVAMLLVAVIMVVSSTYAWFTLSTAPEVTGITTAIGANGSLEMALVPLDGDITKINSNVGIGAEAFTVKNTSWGNLVDLSDNSFYGLDKIVLNPAELNLAVDGKISSGAFLRVPAYGADGRPSEWSTKIFTGAFNNGTFNVNDSKGVRAVGSASGMTERQVIFRDARSAASTAASMAKTKASTSLQNNGNTLANIAIARAADSSATYTTENVDAMKAIVDDLLGYDKADQTHVTGALEYIEEAYKQLVLAYAASSTAQAGGVGDSTVKALYTGLDSFSLESLMETYGTYLSERVRTGYAAYVATKADVVAAQTNIEKLYDYAEANATGSLAANKVEITWDAVNGGTDTSAAKNHPGIGPTLNLLADTNAMQVNGIPASEIRDRMSELVNGVASRGLTVTMATGGGVYADIADQCGDYSAAITIKKVTYGGMTLENMDAKMNTATTLSSTYLNGIYNELTNLAPSSGNAGANAAPLTEMYGYIIDLAFKTNAASSNLLLQTTPKDRIYSDNTSADAATMGGGSTMTFTSTNVSKFSTQQVARLMGAIRVVFFDPEALSIFGTAKLDTDHVTIGTDSDVTASLYLYKNIVRLATDAKNDEGHIVNKNDSTAILYFVNNNKYYTTRTADKTDEEVAAGATQTYTYSNEVAESVVLANENVKTETVETKLEGTDAIIKAMTQNTACKVSVLVYLDGNIVTNDYVAADVATSMVGKMNIQFASSAELVPMEYADLHSSAASVSHSVTLPTGVTGEATAKDKTAYTFTVGTGYTLGTVTVNGSAVEPTAGQNGNYTIPADKVTGNIVITVTEQS